MKKGSRLGEVCKQLDLQPYVLRYWLTEFPLLRGEAGGAAGNRVFTAEEVAVLGRIKTLLYDEGYTIAGAKKKLESEPAAPARAGKKRKAAAPLFEEGDDAPETPKDDNAAADESEVGSLDTLDDERIETLRRGLADALEEARAILDLLQARR
jgi:DNA-binding transcriptional MerR regulator